MASSEVLQSVPMPPGLGGNSPAICFNALLPWALGHPRLWVEHAQNILPIPLLLPRQRQWSLPM